MSGIVFLSTRDLEGMVKFYTHRMGMKIWLDQGGCVILKHGNMLLGFCKGQEADMSGVITFFHPSREMVDNAYEQLKDEAKHPPKENPTYKIYHFYAQDPEGRRLEVQSFLHALLPHMDGEEMLATRRSIRQYSEKDVPEEILENIFEMCQHAPSSRDKKPCRLLTIRDKKQLKHIASLRGESSAPIGRAPLAVAVVVDTALSIRPEQDGSIMGCHLLLASWLNGLGTCWIAAMDRDDVKEMLGIPREHHIATITPMGYPAEKIEMRAY
ncbi:MAG: nitroreductase family protein [Candidatus Thermoplasmatota archaeon]|nr:nitroreductase family protein [Candidatus Thermoplasmatota archaeon]